MPMLPLTNLVVGEMTWQDYQRAASVLEAVAVAVAAHGIHPHRDAPCQRDGGTCLSCAVDHACTRWTVQHPALTAAYRRVRQYCRRITATVDTTTPDHARQRLIAEAARIRIRTNRRREHP